MTMFGKKFYFIAECMVRLWLLLTLESCEWEKQCENCGVILVRTQVFNSNKQDYADVGDNFPNRKIWFKDSTVIQEIKHGYFEKVNNITSKREVNIVGFTFIHLPSHTFFLYKTFTDTAQIVASWKESDSAMMSQYGGWRFYRPYSTPRNGLPMFLKDTVYNGILYKRVKFSSILNGIEGERTFYCQCDKKGTMFQFDKKLSDSLGCPITMIESEIRLSDSNKMRTKIDFVSDRLSENELKVFAAWERNTKENALHK